MLGLKFPFLESLEDLGAMLAYLRHLPKGSSSKTITHYSQNALEDSFQAYSKRYSYRKRKEFKKLKVFDLSNINVPVAMYVGNKDAWGTVKDAIWTRD